MPARGPPLVFAGLTLAWQLAHACTACGAAQCSRDGSLTGARSSSWPVLRARLFPEPLQIRSAPRAVVLRGGGTEERSEDSNAQFINRLSELSDSFSFYTHTPSNSIELSGFGSEAPEGAEGGMTKEQFVDAAMAALAARDAAENQTAAGNESSSDVDWSVPSSSGEYLNGTGEVGAGRVRLFDYVILGGGNAAGYALKELMSLEGVRTRHICLVRPIVLGRGWRGTWVVRVQVPSEQRTEARGTGAQRGHARAPEL